MLAMVRPAWFQLCSARPGGFTTTNQGAAVAPEGFRRDRDAMPGGQVGRILGGVGGSQGLGKNRILLHQLLERREATMPRLDINNARTR